MSTITSDPSSTTESPAEWLDVVRKNVGTLRFGSVQITVHDGRVTLAESIEKTRFMSPRDEAPRLNPAK